MKRRFTLASSLLASKLALTIGLLNLVACVVPAPPIASLPPSVSAPQAVYPIPVSPPSAVFAVAPVSGNNTFLRNQIGNKVALQGSFAGWAGCEESSQLTKSDWVIRFADGNRIACVFVAGAVPQGIAPPPSTLSVGLPVSIQGVVKQSPTNGKPYVQLNP